MLVFIPNEFDAAKALGRTTHMAIGAHPDDLEIMAIHGIGTCYERKDKWFSGVVVTDGANSPRHGKYEKLSDKQMRDLRLDEQERAAQVGDYSALICLDLQSKTVKGKHNKTLVADLAKTIARAQPDVLYTHNLFDAHATHTSVALHVIAAVRSLPEAERPKALYGCEVWRGLDWLPRAFRRELDISPYETLLADLIACFPSQLASKRYDVATAGRKRAHATYGDHRVGDGATSVDVMLDMGPLLVNPELDVRAFAVTVLSEFSKECAAVIKWK